MKNDEEKTIEELREEIRQLKQRPDLDFCVRAIAGITGVSKEEAWKLFDDWRFGRL